MNHGWSSRITMRILPKREHEKTCRANDDVVQILSVMALSPICKAVDVARQTHNFAVGLFFYDFYHRTRESAIIQSTFEQKESHDNYRYRGLFFKNQIRLKQSKVLILKRPTHKSTR